MECDIVSIKPMSRQKRVNAPKLASTARKIDNLIVTFLENSNTLKSITK